MSICFFGDEVCPWTPVPGGRGRGSSHGVAGCRRRTATPRPPSSWKVFFPRDGIPVAARSPRADALVGGPRADRPPNSTAPRGSADHGDRPAKRRGAGRRTGRGTLMSFVRGLVSGSMMIGRLGGPRHATDATDGSRPDAVASTATLDRANVRSSDISRQDRHGIVRADVTRTVAKTLASDQHRTCRGSGCRPTSNQIADRGSTVEP